MSEEIKNIEALSLPENKKKKNKLVIGIIGMMLLLFTSVFIFIKIKTDDQDISKVGLREPVREVQKLENQGFVTDSEAYLQASIDEDNERADKADALGTSSIPRIISSNKDPLPEIPKKQEPLPVVQEQPIQAPVAPQPEPEPEYSPTPRTASGNLQRWMNFDYVPGDIHITKVESRKKGPDIVEQLAGEDDSETLAIEPGSILYAVTDIAVNSDQSGTPVMARVISGEHAGTLFIGGFRLMDKKLVVQFNKAIVTDLKTGKKHQKNVSGYAIDPEKFTPGVASNVDTHWLERWGGVIAASFLEGFGDAKSRSGSTYHYGNDNNPGSFTNNYNASDEAWIAAGKVGERLANQMEKNFDRPPTVTLDPGTPIGILIL